MLYQTEPAARLYPPPRSLQLLSPVRKNRHRLFSGFTPRRAGNYPGREALLTETTPVPAGISRKACPSGKRLGQKPSRLPGGNRLAPQSPAPAGIASDSPSPLSGPGGCYCASRSTLSSSVAHCSSLMYCDTEKAARCSASFFESPAPWPTSTPSTSTVQ